MRKPTPKKIYRFPNYLPLTSCTPSGAPVEIRVAPAHAQALTEAFNHSSERLFVQTDLIFSTSSSTLHPFPSPGQPLMTTFFAHFTDLSTTVKRLFRRPIHTTNMAATPPPPASSHTADRDIQAHLHNLLSHNQPLSTPAHDLPRNHQQAWKSPTGRILFCPEWRAILDTYFALKLRLCKLRGVVWLAEDLLRVQRIRSNSRVCIEEREGTGKRMVKGAVWVDMAEVEEAVRWRRRVIEEIEKEMEVLERWLRGMLDETAMEVLGRGRKRGKGKGKEKGKEKR